MSDRIAIIGGEKRRMEQVKWPAGYDLRFYGSDHDAGPGDLRKLLASDARFVIILTKFNSHGVQTQLRKRNVPFDFWKLSLNELSKNLPGIAARYGIHKKEPEMETLQSEIFRPVSVVAANTKESVKPEKESDTEREYIFGDAWSDDETAALKLAAENVTIVPDIVRAFHDLIGTERTAQAIKCKLFSVFPGRKFTSGTELSKRRAAQAELSKVIMKLIAVKPMSCREIADMTNVDINFVSDKVRKLVAKKILLKRGKGNKSKYVLNKSGQNVSLVGVADVLKLIAESKSPLNMTEIAEDLETSPTIVAGHLRELHGLGAIYSTGKKDGLDKFKAKSLDEQSVQGEVTVMPAKPEEKSEKSNEGDKRTMTLWVSAKTINDFGEIASMCKIGKGEIFSGMVARYLEELRAGVGTRHVEPVATGFKPPAETITETIPVQPQQTVQETSGEFSVVWSTGDMPGDVPVNKAFFDRNEALRFIQTLDTDKVWLWKSVKLKKVMSFALDE